MATQSPNLDLRIPAYGDETDAVADIAENMTKIDTFAGTVGGGARAPFFSYAGLIVTGVSGRWYPANPVSVTRFVASLGTAGTGDTVLSLIRNGDVVTTLTIPSGAFTAREDLSGAIFTETDYLQLGITTAGAAATDLLVELVVV